MLNRQSYVILTKRFIWKSYDKGCEERWTRFCINYVFGRLHAKMHLLMNLVRDDRISFRYIELYIELYEINHRDSKKLETLGNKF